MDEGGTFIDAVFCRILSPATFGFSLYAASHHEMWSMSSIGVTKLSSIHNKVDYKETPSSVFSYCPESVTIFTSEANSRPE